MYKQEIVKRVKNGDEQAFEIMYKDCAPAIYKSAIIRLEDDKLAKLVVRCTFLSIYEGIAELQNTEQFDEWVYKLTQTTIGDIEKDRNIIGLKLEKAPAILDIDIHARETFLEIKAAIDKKKSNAAAAISDESFVDGADALQGAELKDSEQNNHAAAQTPDKTSAQPEEKQDEQAEKNGLDEGKAPKSQTGKKNGNMKQKDNKEDNHNSKVNKKEDHQENEQPMKLEVENEWEPILFEPEEGEPEYKLNINSWPAEPAAKAGKKNGVQEKEGHLNGKTNVSDTQEKAEKVDEPRRVRGPRRNERKRSFWSMLCMLVALMLLILATYILAMENII